MDEPTFLQTCEPALLKRIGTLALANVYRSSNDPKWLFREWLLCHETKAAMRMSGKWQSCFLEWERMAVKHAARRMDARVCEGATVFVYVRPCAPDDAPHIHGSIAMQTMSHFEDMYVPRGSYVFGLVQKGCFRAESFFAEKGVSQYAEESESPVYDFVTAAMNKINASHTKDRHWRVHVVTDDALVNRCVPELSHFTTVIEMLCFGTPYLPA